MGLSTSPHCYTPPLFPGSRLQKGGGGRGGRNSGAVRYMAKEVSRESGEYGQTTLYHTQTV